MNIKQLISETALIGKGRSKSEVFSKKFGSILLYNQMATVQKYGTSVTVSMMISGVTDKISNMGQKQPVAYHKVSLAINNIKQDYYEPEELVALLRRRYSEFSDVDKWNSNDILHAAIEAPQKYFPGSTLFRATNDENKGYCVVSNKIPEDAEIQVWCSCSDYYWTMQFYNCEKDVDLYRAYPQRYIPKTKKGFEAFKSGQPLRNPGRHPGMCKHLMLLLATLMDKGVVEDKDSDLGSYYQANYANFDMKQRRLSMTEYENVIREYDRDHDKQLDQRNLAHRTSYGFKGHSAGWGYKWNAKKGQFVKSPRKKK